jgi:tartrate-resistant acid phosphatase type 5
MLNFLVIGDWGRKGTPTQHTVAQSMAQVADRLQSRFVLTTGDNFYDDGVADLNDTHWTSSFEQVYTATSLQIPWYVTLGNHDYRGSVEAQIAYGTHSARWQLPSRYYAMEQDVDAETRAQFIFLDTSPFIARYQFGGAEFMPQVSEQVYQPQLDWLRDTLAASTAQWKIVIGHHPIYSGSPFHGGAVELQQLILPILRAYAVQAYLCGHEHDLQHLYADDLHYVVSGGGAEYRETGRCPHSCFSASSLGFTALSLTAKCMQIDFYNADAKRIYQTHAASSHRPALMSHSR